MSVQADDSLGMVSKIPAIKDIKKGNFSQTRDSIPAIDLNDDEQLALLDKFTCYYNEIPFKESKNEGMRYYFHNAYYSYMDGIFLYCMLRYLRPENVVEIGSGFSSSLTLDTNELFLKNKIKCIFIEPFPERLKSLIKPAEESTVKIYENLGGFNGDSQFITGGSIWLKKLCS